MTYRAAASRIALALLGGLTLGPTMRRIALLAVILHAGCARAPRAAAERPIHVAPNAPPDRPISTATDSATAHLFALLEPCRRRALASWPDARARFAAGLPDRHTMFVTTRLHDAAGHVEQVFVAVDAVGAGRVSGRLASDVRVVEGYRRGQTLSVAEADVVDWMVARPDGTEEGNWMGRFIDELQATGTPPAGVCDA
jgi:hypothetical protein